MSERPAYEELERKINLRVRKQMENPSLLQWLKTRGSKVQTLAAVCTGSMLLGAAGLLSGTVLALVCPWLAASTHQ